MGTGDNGDFPEGRLGPELRKGSLAATSQQSVSGPAPRPPIINAVRTLGNRPAAQVPAGKPGVGWAGPGPPARGTRKGRLGQVPGLGLSPPSVNSPGLDFGQSAPGARPLTSSVHSLLAPGTPGLGRGCGSRISIWARPTLGSGSLGHLTLVLLQRGRGVEPGAGLGLRQRRRLWARSSSSGVHPAGEESGRSDAPEEQQSPAALASRPL